MKISVVMAVYNGGSRLAATIDSILSQTERDFELIAVDDGSTDDTPQQLASYAERDARVRVITQANSGITGALIRGCSEARAELIARHDSGDWSHAERFAKQLALFDDPEVVLGGSAVGYVGPGGETLYVTEPDAEGMRRSMLHDSVDTIHGIGHGAVMFRRSAYEAAGGYRPQFYFAQDVDLWIRMVKLGKVAMAAETLYFVGVDADTISARNREEQINSARLMIAIRDGGDEPALLAEAAKIRPQRRRGGGRRAKAKALYFIASCLARNGDPAWRSYLNRSLRLDPLSLRGWFLAVRKR